MVGVTEGGTVFFLSFLLLGAIMWLLGLAFAASARRRVRLYSALALLFVVAGLILFTTVSWWAGIVPLRFGDGALIAYSVSMPHRYVARGTLGVAILFVGLLGIVSPAFAAWLVGRQSAKPHAA